MQQKIEEQVRARAYEMWLADGMTHGRELEYWCAAEREVAAVRLNAGLGLESMIKAAKPAKKARKPGAKKAKN